METGWENLMDALSIHAYITKYKAHEAIVEEKQRRENGEEGSSKRATRSGQIKDQGPSQEPSRQVPPPPEVPMEEASIRKKKNTKKLKGRAQPTSFNRTLKLLKKVLKERILNSKVEFTLGEVFGIAKCEFHEAIIYVIKRKRQAMWQAATNLQDKENKSPL
ncbi:hypothetical protein L7F22_053833 [Adiantum nelumboides]|nr:hypothetical protein [Adiantum nelumboides]